jgi:hypothetical protein
MAFMPGNDVHLVALHLAAEHGLRLPLHASQRDRPDVQKKRRSSRRKVHKIEAKTRISVDETGSPRR